MKSTKRLTAVVCVLLCALLLAGFSSKDVRLASSSNSSDSEPLSELSVEKNGRTLDLSLEKLAIEGGNLVISVKIGQVADWGSQDPPKMIVVYSSPSQKTKMNLFSSSSVKPNVTSLKTTYKIPHDGDDLPDQILIDTGDDEQLLFWPAPESESQTSMRPASAKKSGGEDIIAEARELFNDGKYYEAALRIRDCQEDYPGSDAADEGDELMDEIARKLAGKEPQTGELERHFPFYGMNCVKATAESGPFEMIITDVENKSQFVRFYVRQGDTSEIYLPSSHYYVEIRQGDIWFGDKIGFGELGETDDFGGDTLDMTSSSDGSVIRYHTWTPTF